MTDDDLIRRGDALDAIAAALAERSGNDEFGNIMRDVRLQNEADQDAINALPAVTPRPMNDAPRDGTKVLAEWPGVGWVSTEWLRDAVWGGWDSPVGHATPDHPEGPTRFLPHPTEGGSDA